MVPNGLTQDLDQFLTLAPSQSNGLFARESNARRSSPCPSSYYPPTSVGLLCKVKGISVPDETKDSKTRRTNPYHIRGIRKIMIAVTTAAMCQYGSYGSYGSGSGSRRSWFLFALLRLGPSRYAALEAYNRERGRNDGGEPPTEKRSTACKQQVSGGFGVTA